MSLYFDSISDAGDRRQVNQDSLFCASGIVGGVRAGLFVVADGMGGLSYGETVSRYITDQFARWWREDLPSAAETHQADGESLNELLEQEVWDVNNRVNEFCSQNGEKSGSTLSLLLIYGGAYFIKNVGDSRVYLMRRRELTRLTEDQSLVAQMVREGVLQQAEAAACEKKNVLTMCIGVASSVKIFTSEGRAKKDDIFLLCSDGLHHCLTDEQIRDGLLDGKNCGDQAERLRRLIPDGAAGDNVTAIVVNCGKKALFGKND